MGLVLGRLTVLVIPFNSGLFVSDSITHYYLRDVAVILKVLFSNSLCHIVSWVLTVLSSEWWHRAGSTLSQVMAYCLMAWCHYLNHQLGTVPDSEVHGANMGSTWVLSAPDGPHVGPMNLAIRGGMRRYRKCSRIQPIKCIMNYSFKIIDASPRGNELSHTS